MNRQEIIADLEKHVHLLKINDAANDDETFTAILHDVKEDVDNWIDQQGEEP